MSTVSRTRIGRAPRSRALWTPQHPGPHCLPARHGRLWSAVLRRRTNPFMDDHVAYALVLVALPWPARAPRGGSNADTTKLSLVRRCRGCAALTARHGRTGQVS